MNKGMGQIKAEKQKRQKKIHRESVCLFVCFFVYVTGFFKSIHGGITEILFWTENWTEKDNTI